MNQHCKRRKFAVAITFRGDFDALILRDAVERTKDQSQTPHLFDAGRDLRWIRSSVRHAVPVPILESGWVKSADSKFGGDCRFLGRG